MPFSFVDDMVDSINDLWIESSSYDIKNEDYRSSDNGIDSSSVLRNASRVFVLFFQGSWVAFILYSLKAKYITIPDIEAREKSRKKRSPIDIRNFNSDYVQPYNSQKATLSIKDRLKFKLIDMWNEYKYHFFIRLGFQVYLEVWLIVTINLGFTKFENWMQTLSYFWAIVWLVSNL